MRASRLVHLLLVLQVRGGLTAGELATELEVSVRTVYRDLQALAAAGIPVYGLAGPGGGYRLVDGYRTRLTGLTSAEAEALLLVDLSVPLSALGLGSDLLVARLKVTAALPGAVRARAGELAGRVHLDLPGWFEAADAPPALPLLAAAVLADQQVRFRYGGDGPNHMRFRYGRPGTAEVRIVEPLGLVLKGRSWYLVARRGERMLTYSVRRMRDLELTDRAVVRPDDFDLATTWDRLVAEFEATLPSVEVVVRASPAALARLRSLVDPRSRDQTDWGAETIEGGWKQLSIRFERLEHAKIALLGLGGDVEVLEPSDLRETMTAEARAVARLYRISSGDGMSTPTAAQPPDLEQPCVAGTLAEPLRGRVGG
jgi:predicted DNA-binding transcriptional regulator YafY